MNKESAFPRPASRGNNYLTGEEDVVVDPQKGMTLRDYFAAKAMHARLTTYEGTWYEGVAEEAYKAADAMLKERET